jgi:hypothetical protein
VVLPNYARCKKFSVFRHFFAKITREGFSQTKKNTESNEIDVEKEAIHTKKDRKTNRSKFLKRVKASQSLA